MKIQNINNNNRKQHFGAIVIKDEEAEKMIDAYNKANGLRTGITPFDFEKMGFDDPL